MANPHGVLAGDGRDGGGSIAAKGGYGLQVCLNAGPSRRVRAGNGKDAFH